MPSSVIRRFDYDPQANRLDITFVSGRRYSYHQVPEDVVAEMRAAFSKGQYYNLKIRDRFTFTRQA